VATTTQFARDPQLASQAPEPAHTPPTLSAVIKRVATSLTIACVMPGLLFSLAMLVFSVSAAVFTGLVWTSSVMIWRWATKRPVSWLLVLTGTIMTVRTTFTLATGNTFVYFIQPVFADAAIATIFLASLCSARPIVARLAPDFYPMDPWISSRPRIRRLLWRLTLMWGLVIVAKGTVTFWLLTSLPVVNFVLVKNATVITVTVIATAMTIWLSAIAVRKEGLAPAAV
jgi:hypothetical protein